MRIKHPTLGTIPLFVSLSYRSFSLVELPRGITSEYEKSAGLGATGVSVSEFGWLRHQYLECLDQEQSEKKLDHFRSLRSHLGTSRKDFHPRPENPLPLQEHQPQCPTVF